MIESTGIPVLVDEKGFIGEGKQLIGIEFANRIGFICNKDNKRYLKFFYRLNGAVNSKKRTIGKKIYKLIKIPTIYITQSQAIYGGVIAKVPSQFQSLEFLTRFRNLLMSGESMEDILKTTGYPDRELKRLRLLLIKHLNFNPAEYLEWNGFIKQKNINNTIKSRKLKMEEQINAAGEWHNSHKPDGTHYHEPTLRKAYENLPLKNATGKKIEFATLKRKLQKMGFI